ncbi:MULTISPECIES: SURF1 family protein [unclassified Streptomyces]|uniref:SURF1 family protein n=1 Tax=unclassified Streptomyces TaxID=2593676 RepID=UPI002250B366|nr:MULTISPECIES: SURF1 family protein [unclassified Streptomyces]MCX4527144.1 SURF1 family protein [Streptomyces sp. NBC_01551]MCX4542280.1 SURF1 family protein [Streptomyces sp. NBC_01565]
MHRFLLTPRWWGINVFVALGVPFCLFMGSWQLGRFEDRVDSHREATAERPAGRTAAPLDSLLPVDKNTSGRLASTSGEYGEQLLVPERTLDGKSGFYVLTLLKTDSGKAVPVVRGWLPGAPDAARAPAAPTGRVEVTGALQASETSGSKGVHAVGGLPAGQLGVIGAASLVNIVPYDLYDAWLTVQSPADGLTPVPAQAPANTGLDLKAFQNLGYTGEWFVFAAFVLFMWFRLYRREAETLRDAEAGLLPEEPAPATAVAAPEPANP